MMRGRTDGSNPQAVEIATDVLLREAAYLDDTEWNDWLDLYAPEAVYWVPAWLDESTETTDPDREISQIYHDSRRGLEERVNRVQSAKSVTTMPLPRTMHSVTNVIAAAADRSSINARANFVVHVFQPRTAKQYVNFGRYEVELVASGESWLIGRKKIHLKNDLVPALIDFYTL